MIIMHRACQRERYKEFVLIGRTLIIIINVVIVIVYNCSFSLASHGIATQSVWCYCYVSISRRRRGKVSATRMHVSSSLDPDSAMRRQPAFCDQG